MPAYRITPPQTAVCIEGVQFTARPDGLFELPANGTVIHALQNHGLTVEFVAKLEEELDFESLADRSAAQAARIAELEALLAAVKAEPATASVTPAAAADAAPMAGGAAVVASTGKRGKPAPAAMVGDGAASTQAAGSTDVPPADTAPVGADGNPAT